MDKIGSGAGAAGGPAGAEPWRIRNVGTGVGACVLGPDRQGSLVGPAHRIYGNKASVYENKQQLMETKYCYGNKPPLMETTRHLWKQTANYGKQSATHGNKPHLMEEKCIHNGKK